MSAATVKRHHFLTYYRLQNRPDDELDVYDVVPIFPATRKGITGPDFIHDYHREIAWSVDYRGDHDDVPTLVYTGAGYTLIKKVFLQLFYKYNGLIHGFSVYRETYVYPRHGRAWWRVAVELKDMDTQMMSLQSLGNLMEYVIKKTCLCNIQYVKLDKFLNL